MRLAEIDPEKLVLVRWRDILWCYKPLEEDDIELKSPLFEIAGRIKYIKRGLAVVQVEWGVMKDYEDEYDGDAGKETQIIPVGCIESVRELKLGKHLFKKETEKDGGASPKSGGISETAPGAG